MKLKILLLAIFAAGLSASLAFAEDGKPKDKGPACTPVHLEGTIAPQSLTMTVTKGSDGAPASGTQVALTVGTTGQTVRVNVEACTTGSGSTLQYIVKHVELQPLKPKPAGTTTGEHHGDKPKPSSTTTTSGDGEHGEHKGGTTTTTTAATTTAATTTSPTTTTTP